MKAREFIDVWEKFVNEKSIKDRLLSNWNNKSKWTEQTIGYACAVSCPSDNDPQSEGHSPFGEYLIEALRTGWRYQKEYKHVDLVIARKDNMRRPYSWEAHEQVLWSAHFHPIIPEILIEQESSCGISWQEMEKLILLRSRLKVLITYTYDKGHEQSENLNHATSRQFKAMLEDAWRECPEFEETEYLLIIGQLDEAGEDAKANWYCSIFSANGTAVPKEAWMDFSTLKQ